METEKLQLLDFFPFYLEDCVCFLCKFFFHEQSQYNRRRSCGNNVEKKKKGERETKGARFGGWDPSCSVESPSPTWTAGFSSSTRAQCSYTGCEPHMHSRQDRRKVSDRSISCLGFNQLGFSLRGVSSTLILWNSSITEIELQKQRMCIPRVDLNKKEKKRDNLGFYPP
ncbi:hypothetical protein NE237_014021 [Protea cynaroides]|uniref:Uncharacterized protein n=1 Tax=Protea cynaroides TaxID=273540 RepID=A0A9Q0H0E1_9MAGN|nr:hypothetical protein NE237_014021 [Protea cynaroides]